MRVRIPDEDVSRRARGLLMAFEILVGLCTIAALLVVIAIHYRWM